MVVMMMTGGGCSRATCGSVGSILCIIGTSSSIFWRGFYSFRNTFILRHFEIYLLYFSFLLNKYSLENYSDLFSQKHGVFSFFFFWCFFSKNSSGILKVYYCMYIVLFLGTECLHFLFTSWLWAMHWRKDLVQLLEVSRELLRVVSYIVHM